MTHVASDDADDQVDQDSATLKMAVTEGSEGGYYSERDVKKSGLPSSYTGTGYPSAISRDIIGR